MLEKPMIETNTINFMDAKIQLMVYLPLWVFGMILVFGLFSVAVIL